MATRKDDLALSLSLGGGREEAHQRAPALQLNLIPSAAAAATSPSAFLTHQKSPATLWNDLLASSFSDGRRNPTEMFGGNTTRHFLKGIDVNRAPAVDRLVPDEEEEAGVSSPNSTVSSVVSGSGLTGSKRSDRGEDQDHLHSGHRPNSGSIGDESELVRAGSRGISDDEDGGEGSRKKLRLSKEQSAVLEESFKEHNTLNPKQKLALSKQLNLRPRQVEVWFQNRRARTKLKQTEVDCEFLKRCCENLTEENRRLQKEVQELRALKLSPQLYMHMTPPTTLTMCPSCERVAVAASTSSAAAPSTDNRAPHAGAHPLRPQQQLQARPLLPDQHRPVPMTSTGAGHSLPWAPTPLRAAAFADAPRPHS